MSPLEGDTALIFGCGYLGIRVARRLIREGWHVVALTRSTSRATQLAAEGIEPRIGDWNDARSLQGTPKASRVLVAVGYDGRSGRSRHEVYVEGLRQALGAIPADSRVCYVSSTGVFHQSDGRWVDETAPCHPAAEGGRAHLRAEELLRRVRQRRSSDATVVLRMAGLYGPGRVPRVAAIRRGEALPSSPSGYLNLIHIDDAAECVLQAWEHPSPAPLYVIADGHPVVREDYYREIARLSGSPPPRFADPSAAPSTGSRSDSNKRIWTARMRRDLRSRLSYRSYREGLRSILARR